MLSGRTAAFIILSAVILSRAMQLIYFYYLGGDRSHQALAAQNLYHGHGISISYTEPGNLSEILYEPLIKWPPGYSYLLSFFYMLLNEKHILAGFVLDLLFAILLILASRRILKLLNVSSGVINAFTLFTGFILYSFYRQPYADAIAISFFIIAIFYTLRIFNSEKKQFIQSIIVALCLAGSAYSKYLYMPIAFIVPLYLYYTGVIHKKPEVKKSAIIIFLFITTAVAALLFFQKSVSGSAVYIPQPKRGFYPENLLSFYPAIPASVLNPETAGMTLQTGYNQGNPLYQIYQAIHLLLVAVMIFFLVKYFSNKKRASPDIQTFFSGLVWVLTGSVLVVLIFLSLWVAKELDIWTYLQEARYYGLIVVLVQLFIFQVLGTKRKWLNVAWVVILVLMIPDTMRGMIFTARRITLINKEQYSWQYEYNVQKFAEDILEEKKIAYRTDRVVLACSSDYMNNRICLNSHIPMLKDPAVINNIYLLNAEKPVIVLVILRKDDMIEKFSLFLNNPKKIIDGEFGDFYFYTLYVEPH